MSILGAVGEAAASAASAGTAGASPLRTGQIAYLSVSADELVLFQAKRGAFRPKPTDEVVASAPRSTVESATLEKGRIAGVLEISFAGGSNWAFDIPKVHLGGAAAGRRCPHSVWALLIDARRVLPVERKRLDISMPFALRPLRRLLTSSFDKENLRTIAAVKAYAEAHPGS